MVLLFTKYVHIWEFGKLTHYLKQIVAGYGYQENRNIRIHGYAYLGGDNVLSSKAEDKTTAATWGVSKTAPAMRKISPVLYGNKKNVT